MDDMTTPQAEPLQPSAASPDAPVPAPAAPAPASVPPAPLPVQPASPRTNVGLFILGLVTPMVVLGILTTVAGLLSSTIDYSDPVATTLLSVLSIATTSIMPLLFFAFLAAWLVGRQKGNVKLSSFGRGGMWAYAVGALGALLLFGTCIVALSGGGF